MNGIRPCFAATLALATALAALAPAQAAPAKRHHSRHQRHHHAAVHKPAAHRETAAVPAAPASPAAQTLGTSGRWTAYVAADGTGKVCYLVGQPQKSEPGGSSRLSASAMVTHRPAENIRNVVSFVEGTPLKAGSEVTLDIGGKKFALFINGDSAWARTSELDRTIVRTLARGREAVVKGLPQKGPATTDIYALAGFAKALAMIDQACGVKR